MFSYIPHSCSFLTRSMLEELHITTVHETAPTLHLLITDEHVVLADQVLNLLRPRVPELLPLRPQLHKLAVFGSKPEEGTPDLLGTFEGVFVALRYGGDVVVLNVLVQAGASQLLGQVAQQQGHPLVHIGEPTIRPVSARSEVCYSKIYIPCSKLSTMTLLIPDYIMASPEVGQ